MLHLKSSTTDAWLRRVTPHLDELLIDHAHCERKAAGTAMSLLSAYVENQELCRQMTRIITEELEHFHQVLQLLERRGIRFRRLTPSSYGRRLHERVRKSEPQRAIDRLLVAGLIEARSCERFGLLTERIGDQELASFYGSLFEIRGASSQHLCPVGPGLRRGITGTRATGRTGAGRSAVYRRRR